MQEAKDNNDKVQEAKDNNGKVQEAKDNNGKVQETKGNVEENVSASLSGKPASNSQSAKKDDALIGFKRAKRSNKEPELKAMLKKQRGERKKNAGTALKDRKSYVYMGPNLPGGKMFTGTIYRGKPTHLNDVFQAIPEVKKLLVEAQKFLEFKSDLQKQGTEAFRLYQKVETNIKKGVLNNGV